MIYFDSAYLAKFYLDEPESDAVRAAAEAAGEVACSMLGRLEVVSVFHRKWREKTQTKTECRSLMEQFEADCDAGLWTWLGLSQTLVDVAAGKYRKLPEAVFLRAADAIHLATAAEVGLRTIHTNDRHLLAAAPHFGLAGTVIT